MTIIPVVRGLRVAGERVEEARGQHAVHVGQELDDDGDERQGRRRFDVAVEQDVGEMEGEEDEADQVRPNVDRLVVQPEPATEIDQ